MAVTYTIGSSGKFLTSVLKSLRKGQEKMVRGLPKMKINTSYPPQIEATSRYQVVSDRCFCPSVHFTPGERIKCFKPFNVGWSYVPVTRITSPVSPHLWGGPKLFAIKPTDTSERSEGGPVKSGGGRVGRLGAAHEAGHFHELSLSKLQQMKRMIRKKAEDKKKEERKPDPFSSLDDHRSVNLESRSGFI